MRDAFQWDWGAGLGRGTGNGYGTYEGKEVSAVACTFQAFERRQDESLDDIELHVNRIGRMGRAIGEELEGQGGLLDELDQDMDTTQSRLKATQKKMQLEVQGGLNTKVRPFYIGTEALAFCQAHARHTDKLAIVSCKTCCFILNSSNASVFRPSDASFPCLTTKPCARFDSAPWTHSKAAATRFSNIFSYVSPLLAASWISFMKCTVSDMTMRINLQAFFTALVLH
eukprot:1136674-Pelagomonas_calceolata.AAC.1